MPYHKDYIGHEQEICDAYVSGISKERLRIKYRCHFSIIGEILDKAGIEQRSPSEARQTYDVDQSYFDDINSPEKAYLLGFLWADGSRSFGRSVVALGLAARDEEVLIKTKQWLKSSHPIERGIRKGGYGDGKPFVRLSITNQRLSKALESLGMSSDKTHDIHWPSIHKDLERHFIRGYFDGDGSWCNALRTRVRNKRGTSTTICDGAISIAINKGFADTFVEKVHDHTGFILRKAPHASPIIYQLVLTGRLRMLEFGKWLYTDSEGLRLERKHTKYLEMLRFYDQPVKEEARV